MDKSIRPLMSNVEILSVSNFTPSLDKVLYQPFSYTPFLAPFPLFLLIWKAHIEPSNLYQTVCSPSISHNCGDPPTVTETFM